MKGRKRNLAQLLTESPFAGSELNLERIRDLYSGETEKLLAEVIAKGNFSDREEAVKAALRLFLDQNRRDAKTR